MINSLYLSFLAFDSLSAAIVDEVSETDMYVGYCAPDCKGYDDNKWLIKRIHSDENGKTIFLSNGSKEMNCRWIDRKNGNISYAATTVWQYPETPNYE